MYCGDSKQVLEYLAGRGKYIADMVITSPPYWAARDYGVDGQLGQELSFREYVMNLCDYLDPLYTLIELGGTLWVNLGDGYYGASKGTGGRGHKQDTSPGSFFNPKKFYKIKELKEKTLCMIPSRFAIEMTDYRGWILRNDIIWHKPNQMPNSAKDRFTVDYEHLFMFSREKKYKFNQQLERSIYAGDDRGSRGDSRRGTGYNSVGGKTKEFKNKRTVWSINTQPHKGLGHFAPYPDKLVETPIMAGSNEGDTVLDPFLGSGTTAIVAERLGRKWIGIELNEEYCNISLREILDHRREVCSLGYDLEI